MRLFIALDIEERIRTEIAKFSDELRSLAPKARWVSPESLHITLKFIGEQPDAKVEKIENALSGVSGTRFQITFRGCGFFPAANSARVFWVGIEADPELNELASHIEDVLQPLGIEKEKRAFSPHLTLARGGSGSGAPGREKRDRPNQVFAAVRDKLESRQVPEFGTRRAGEFFLYRSVLSSKGAQYTKMARFALLDCEK